MRTVIAKQLRLQAIRPMARRFCHAARNWWLHYERRYGLRWRIASGGAVLLLIISIVVPVMQNVWNEGRYTLSAETRHLIGQPDPALTKLLRYDSQKQEYQFNGDAQQTTESLPAKLTAAVGGATGAQSVRYSADLPTDLNQGVSYYDVNTGLSFSVAPVFGTGGGRQIDGHMIYPISGDAQAIYTPKANGIREDIVVQHISKDTMIFKYNLHLPVTLEARMIPGTGEIGIYSADKMLFNNISFGSDADRARVDQARERAPKNNLVFVLPAPVIRAANGASTGAARAYFKLSGKAVTVVAQHLSGVSVPITIDPSVVVTSTTDFQLGGNNESMIDYTTAGQISRGGVTSGTIGSWATTTALTTPHDSPASIAYNGYLYVLGGRSNSTTYLTSVQYAPINSDGTIGSWTATTSLASGRRALSAVAYNGHMYAIGGTNDTSYYSDVFSAVINANGSIGAWVSTTSLPTGQAFQAATAYNGYMYVLGGYNGTTYSANVYVAVINADGTIGSWTATTSFTTARGNLVAVMYNGYAYILAGYSPTNGQMNDVQYAPINSDGTVGAWNTTATFTTPRNSPGVAIWDGYIYIMGGYSGSTSLNDVQYAPVKSNGTVGTWTSTSSFTTGRDSEGYAVYNGYLYILGGNNGGFLSDTQYVQITPASSSTAPSMSSWSSTTSFPTGREDPGAVAYNGYLYILGGWDGTNMHNDVYYASISSNGTIGSWTSTSLFSGPRYAFGVAAYNGYLYILGGHYGGNPVRYNDVQYAAVNSDGSLNAWTATTSFNVARAGHIVAAYNGYLYVAGGYDGTTYRNDVQYAPINSDGTVGSWTTTTSFPTGRAYFTGMAYNGYLYVMAGTTGSAYLSDVEYAAINGDGSIGSWAATTSLPVARSSLTSTVYNGYVYVMSGHDASAYYNDSRYAKINADGTIGSWTTGTSFTTVRSDEASANYNGYVYILGGYDGTNYYNDVQYAKVTASVTTNSSPAIPAWTTDTSSPLDQGRQDASTVAYNGFIYVIGGFDSTGAGDLASVYYAPINVDGSIGTWTATASLMAARDGHASVVYNGYIYALGGENSTYINSVEYAQIKTDGSGGLNAWANANTGASFDARAFQTAAAYNGYVYVLGGNNSTGNLNTVYSAQINPNGTLGAWSPNTSFNTARSTHAGLIYNGYIYVIGGYNSTTLSSIEYSKIGANGVLGTWASAGTMSSARTGMKAVANDGYVYLIAGYNGTTGVTTVEYAPFRADGTIGSWTATTSINSPGRDSIAVTTYNGYAYMMGGYNGTGPLSDVQYAQLGGTTGGIARKASYSKLIDLGSPMDIGGISYNGQPSCNDAISLQYKTAGNSGVFGATTAIGPAVPGTNYSFSLLGIRYVWVRATLDDTTCGAPSSITDLTVTYAVPAPPAPPTLISPASGATGVSLSPSFSLRTSDNYGTYARYKIDICSTSNCSTIVRTIDQTASQTGWSGQDAQSGTAYVLSSTLTSSTVATYAYQPPPLSVGTQYWWRAYAIDPDDSNTWSAVSGIQSFTTTSTETAPASPTLNGPASGATGVSTQPVFTLRSTDAQNDYLEYKIDICSTSNCSTIVRTIDQTASQTGWSGQDAQSGTAYVGSSTLASSTMATYTYQAPALVNNTQYWWRAYAIDPGGTDTWSAVSAISSFTTAAGAQTEVRIQGGTRILGGTRIGS